MSEEFGLNDDHMAGAVNRWDVNKVKFSGLVRRVNKVVAEERSLSEVNNDMFHTRKIIYRPESSGEAEGDCSALRSVAKERSVDMLERVARRPYYI